MVTQLQIPNPAQPNPVNQVFAPPFLSNLPSDSNPALSKRSSIDTVLPLRHRSGLTEYTVEPGDTLFTIAARFNLLPETVLWSNRYNIGDDPHMIFPGQKLIIMPVDGTMHV